MEKSIESVRRNFNTVRTGRANVAILDRIQARPPRALRCRRGHASLRRHVAASPARCAEARCSICAYLRYGRWTTTAR